MAVYGYDATPPPAIPEFGPIVAGYLPHTLIPADLPDTRCLDCGHPRTCDVCSCTGPGTCGGSGR